MNINSISNNKKRRLEKLKSTYQLYIFLLPSVLCILIFHYWPMYGAQIAFRDYSPALGIWKSPWVGLKHIVAFVNSFSFWKLIKNTLSITLYSLVVGFPIPIIFALMLNELKNNSFKKIVQTITYAPHFISTVVMIGMILSFLSPSTGIINYFIKSLGKEPIYFMIDESWFRHIYVWSGIWQNTGWGSIIYLSALSSINVELYESATIDGANRFQRIRHINLPGIMSTIVIMFILRVGGLMSLGFEKVYLMQNPLNLTVSDIISTYVYRIGLEHGDYSFSSAVSIFNSSINFMLLIAFNKIARSISEFSLW